MVQKNGSSKSAMRWIGTTTSNWADIKGTSSPAARLASSIRSRAFRSPTLTRCRSNSPKASTFCHRGCASRIQMTAGFCLDARGSGLAKATKQAPGPALRGGPSTAGRGELFHCGNEPQQPKSILCEIVTHEHHYDRRRPWQT